MFGCLRPKSLINIMTLSQITKFALQKWLVRVVFKLAGRQISDLDWQDHQPNCYY